MRLLKHTASGAAGVIVAAILVFGTTSLGSEERPRTEPTVPEPVTVPVDREPRPPAANVFLAWVPSGTGGLPTQAESLLLDTKGVTAVTIAHASLDWIRSSEGAGGAQMDAPPAGMKIPVEVVAVDRARYSRFVPPSDRAAIASLRPGEVLLSETGAALRDSGTSMEIALDSGRYRVSGVISDTAANGYEIVMAGPPPPTWQLVDRFALVQADGRRARPRIAQTLKRTLAPGQVLRIRARGETPYLRYGDAVMPQSIIKESFGEFAARPLSNGTISIEQSWVEKNIARERVPILGEIVCHRALFPQLRDALKEVRRRGLSFLIDTSQFGGCYGPRFIGRVSGGRLSHHAWGIAIDINAADNAFGTPSDLDPRLVEIMERSGLTWGGRWLVPDGMHFEWVRFP